MSALILRSNGEGGYSTLLAVALSYATRGWSIILVFKKKAISSWLQYQTQPPDEETLRQLFDNNPDVTGLAVILGNASGGLACRDFDQAESYHRWAAANPYDAKRLPTARTFRGYHVYGRVDHEVYLDLGDGEFRADSGHYVLLPPSALVDREKNLCGGTYEWVVPLPPVGTPLPIMPDSLKRYWGLEEDPKAKITQPNPTQHISCAPCTVEEAITNTLPTGPGMRRRRVFDLARQLKAIMPNAEPDDLKPIVKNWHELAFPHTSRAHPNWCDSWNDFAAGWEEVEHPWGQSLRAAMAAAETITLTGAAAKYTGDLRRLAALCARLQEQCGDTPFFLSCRDAGDFISKDKTVAWRTLKKLRQDGIIQSVTTGSKATGKASEWRFVNREDQPRKGDNPCEPNP